MVEGVEGTGNLRGSNEMVTWFYDSKKKRYNVCLHSPYSPSYLSCCSLSLWHSQSHSSNSSPDFRVVTRNLGAKESPCFSPRKLRKVKSPQSKFCRKDMLLVFQVRTQKP